MSIAAYNKKIVVRASGSTTWLELPATNATLNLEADALDDTDFTTTGFRSRIIGLRDWSISVPSNYDPTNQAIVAARQAWFNRTKLEVRYLIDGTNGFQGDGYVDNFSLSGEVGGLETCDINIVPDGALSVYPST